MKSLLKTLFYVYLFTLMIFSICALLKCSLEKSTQLHCPYWQQEINLFINFTQSKPYFEGLFSYLNVLNKTLLNIMVLSGYVSIIAIALSFVYYLSIQLFNGIALIVQLAMITLLILILLLALQKINVDSDIQEQANRIVDLGANLVSIFM